MQNRPPMHPMMERQGRPKFVSKGDGGSGAPPTPPEDEKPKNLRERAADLRKNAGVTLSGIPRAFGLVWQGHKGYTLAIGSFAVVAGLVPAISALISGALINEVADAARTGATDARVQAVIGLAVAQFAVLVASSLMQTLLNINQQALQELTAMRIQRMLMEHANRLDLRFFEDPKFYDSLQQAQQQATFRPLAMVQQMFGLVRSLITFVSLVAILLTLGWLVAVLALLSPIPSFIASARYGWQGYMLSRRQSPERRRMSYLLDLVTKDTYNKEIKLFGLGNYFIDRWGEIASRFYKENRTLVRRRYLAGFGLGSLSTIVSSGTFLYVALQTVRGLFNLGQLTVYTQAVGQVQSSFQSILDGVSGMYENSLYLNTLYEFLDYTPAIQSPPDAIKLTLPLKQGVEFRHVSFTYPGKETPALLDVSFTIKLDETIALVGQNGAGKTTVVKLLSRLYDPDEGAILIDGHDLREYDLDSLRASIGVIFQDYATYFFSARENIGVGKLAEIDNQEMVGLAAGKSGANVAIEKLPNGYETTLGRWFDEGYQLSGGEWQKVALARAFMRDAEILILDEPTASLDARAEYEIFAQMKALTTGKMALFISHRFSTVRLADRILVLEDGRIKEDGTHAELLTLGGSYAELFNLQAASYR